MEVAEVSKKKRKKKTRSQRIASRTRNKDNDPLQNFDGDVNMDGLAGDEDGDDEEDVEEDKFFDGVEDDGADVSKEVKNQAFLDMEDEGYGKSTAGRNAWKEKHNKGKFNKRKLQEKHDKLHKW
jgi:hypothetical protein